MEGKETNNKLDYNLFNLRAYIFNTIYDKTKMHSEQDYERIYERMNKIYKEIINI